ncbi:hypothetical protein HZA71_00320 [Candidatus Falkowbacteria bacterium]|nr:hypothetical protein [Candidatus Falkowbacteria bacterium]
MKKFIFLLAPLYLLIAPIIAQADDKLNEAVKGTPLESRAEIYIYIGSFIQYILGTLGIVLVILIIFGGFTWMTANGDSAKIDKAKGILTASIIGLIIALIAYIITFTVVTNLQQFTQKA